ncbi:metallophosphoesterase [Gallibacterium salpingitidis]|uniref:metallophosphoesterase n=1 Tax=Gallibacterium salpingitidis TaxID=505341 RepID=UPI00266FBB48|nr:metallophosphoesterase [Gallibacterium salpingitidis]WKT00172.1 metallophosphoesterase [Gallibacterium salpingitidis]
MVFRYLIFVFLQILIFVGIKAVDWFFLHKTTTPYYKRPFVWGCYLVINAFLLLSVFHFIPNGFRYSAYILIGLWYITLVVFFLWASKKILALFKIPLPSSPILSRGIAILLLTGLCSYSVHQAYVPQVVHYSVQIDKAVKPFRIGVASDLHLGKLFGSKQLEKLQQIFMQQKVDIVLLPGDIMDDNLQAYFQQKMQPYFAKLSSPLGVYATLGNHDFFQQPTQIANEIRREGVYLLTDQAVVVSNQFIIVGRNDELDLQRQPIEKILATIPAEKRAELPILLMDHRPFSITENSQAGVDIQVSGHTHRGQIFPFNLIVHLMYQLSYGYQQFAQMHTFVTSGYGFWGVPFRLGSQSEVMIIDVSSKESR